MVNEQSATCTSYRRGTPGSTTSRPRYCICLASLGREVDRRRALSHRYEAGFGEKVAYAGHGANGAPHLSVVRVHDPADVAARLRDHDIDSGRHYPRSLADQPVLAEVPCESDQRSRRARTCLSLPLHRRLADHDVDRVIDAVVDATQVP